MLFVALLFLLGIFDLLTSSFFDEKSPWREFERERPQKVIRTEPEAGKECM